MRHFITGKSIWPDLPGKSMDPLVRGSDQDPWYRSAALRSNDDAGIDPPACKPVVYPEGLNSTHGAIERRSRVMSP